MKEKLPLGMSKLGLSADQLEEINSLSEEIVSSIGDYINKRIAFKKLDKILGLVLISIIYARLGENFARSYRDNIDTEASEAFIETVITYLKDLTKEMEKDDDGSS